MHSRTRRNTGLVAALALFAVVSAAEAQYPKCSQPHVGKQHRAESLAKRGDARMAKSAAGHAVRYAIERYGLKDIVTNADIAHADREMYDFLSWKLGNPSLVAAQWLTAGYQHFDSHADEAAAALLGTDLPGPGAQVRLPKALSDYLKRRADSLSSTDGSPASICVGFSDTTYVGFACESLMPYVQEAMRQSIDRIGISNAALIGKNKYDVKTAEIAILEETRRNPPPPMASASNAGTRTPSTAKVPARIPGRRP